MAKILVTDKLDQEAIKLLKAKAQVDEFLDQDQDAIIAKIPAYDALVVRSKTKVTDGIITAGKNLKVVGRAGTGLDNVDVEAAKTRGIKVLNTPGASSISVAELTIALALALLRKIPQADSSVKGGGWEKKLYKGNEISGKEWGILGFGNIGRTLARMLSGFDCEILAYDPMMDEATAKKLNVRPVALETLFKESDIISIHVPLLPETRYIVGDKQLSLMKSSSTLIHIARGGIVDEGALYKALKENRIRGAALDVFEKEPPEGSPLLKLENVVFTPHLGAQTEEGQGRVGIEIAQKVLSELGI
ncbi:MAG: hydroxyacid dehydrogenase [Candidatus Altiarchaeota archaeon]|nr:hydroxyacid dehydrogenase [Candidatus Altiarchaeota archaeon]